MKPENEKSSEVGSNDQRQIDVKNINISRNYAASIESGNFSMTSPSLKYVPTEDGSSIVNAASIEPKDKEAEVTIKNDLTLDEIMKVDLKDARQLDNIVATL